MGVPRMCFVNKMDRMGANFYNCVGMIKDQLGAVPAVLQVPIATTPTPPEADFEGVVDLVTNEAIIWSGEEMGAKFDRVPIADADIAEDIKEKAAEYRAEMIELAVEQDEDALMAYLEGEEPDAETLKKCLRTGTLSGAFVPVLTGTAFKNKGVQPLLDAVVDYMPAPDDVEAIKGTSLDGETSMERISSDDEPFSALAFKIMTDPFVGTLTFCRIYSGILNAGDGVYNSVKGQRERVGRMLQMHANDRTEVKSKKDQDKMGEALARLAAEDPSFRTKYDEENAQTIISGMGELHLEIIVDRLQREFGVEANVGAPQVSYREAITAPAEVDFTHKKQSGGSGQYARCKVQFAPLEGEESADFVFASEIKGGAVPKEYIPGVQKGIEDVLKTGVLAGYPVLGMKATLVDGAFHDVDSSVLAFEIAGRGCCREGLRKGKVRLMEPMMQVDVTTPEDYMGDVIGDINSRRGLVGDLGERGNAKTIRASVPLANMFQYVSTLRSISKGRASYSMKLASYDFVPPNVEKELMAKFTPSEED